MLSLSKPLRYVWSLCTRLLSWMYGEFSQEELKKFSFLSLIFFTIIGTYWLLRPLKDVVFMNVVGEDYLPMAKVVSMALVLPLVLLYSKLIDWFSRRKIFYILCTIYSILALLFAFLIYTTGIDPMLASSNRYWGWAWYTYVESFGSLLVALFWGYAADITKPESASRGYPLIALGGQFGNIVFPWILGTFVSWCAVVPMPECPVGETQSGALAITVLFGGVLMLLIMFLLYLFLRIIPQDQLVGYGDTNAVEEESNAGLFEGLRILFSSGYLLGIYAIIMAYEIIITILDFNFKTFVKVSYPDPNVQTIYLANWGFWVGIVSFFSIILGINKIQRKLGLGVSLALLPILIAVVVIGFKIHPFLGVLFWIMVFSKAVNYALTQPSIKQLYIPTSKQAKYKAQAFIELYGSRGSKALGSGVNFLRKPLILKFGVMTGLNLFITICTFASLGIIGVWFVIALYLGRTFKKAVEQNEVVV